MKRTLSSLMLAISLTAGISHAQPIVECRRANQYDLQQINNQYERALRDFELLKADRERYKAMYEPIVARKPGGGTLQDCRNKTQAIAKLGEALNAMIAGSDKALSACRRKNNDHYTSIEVAIDTASQQRDKGGITSSVEGTIWDHRRGIDSERQQAEARGFTMADCQAIAQRLRSYQAFVETICFDADTSRVGVRMVCAKVE